jgi:hypothetical protein
VYVKANDEHLLADWTRKGSIVSFPIFVLLKPVRVQVFDRHVSSSIFISYPYITPGISGRGSVAVRLDAFVRLLLATGNVLSSL